MKNLRISLLCAVLLMTSLGLSAQVYSMFETMIGIGRVPEATLDINSDPGDDALRVRVNNATTFRVLSNLSLIHI